MDEQLAIREKTKEHYNQHVGEGVTTAQALKARRQGPAAPLKMFHNEIKRRLIYRFAYGAESLLDYACGRGGDIHKWKSAQVRYVKGLDLSPREVEEAKRRYMELVTKDPAMCMRCDFEQTDHLGLQLVQEAQPFDVITCMFALHYFFVNEQTCKMIMATIAANLREGGFFIACVPDGKRVKAHLKPLNGELIQPHLCLKQKWEGKDSPFGSAYVMTIPDTVVEGHEGFTEGSEEFLVFDKVLLAVAKANGLQPVVDFADPALDALFEPTDVDKPMKHFNPNYPAETHGSLAVASKLYMAFVLQKVSSPEEVAAPPLPPPEVQRGGGGGGGGGGRQQQQQQQARGRGRRSPTRSERYGEVQAPAVQQLPQERRFEDQQQQQQWRGGGGGGRGRNADWQLPYHSHTLPPSEMPSAYNNNRHLHERELKGRFVIKLPLLPYCAGPVQYDEMGKEILSFLPDGRHVRTYYDELDYHVQQQQQQAPPGAPAPSLAAAGAVGAGGQQQQHGAPSAAGHSGGRPPGLPQQQQQQQQPPPGGFPLPPQAPSAPQQLQQQQQQLPAAAAERETKAAGASSGGGRGRGRGRGGTKRSRESADGSAAAAAAAAGNGRGGAGADQQAEHAPAAKKPAGGRGGGRGSGGVKAPAPDPLGYKSALTQAQVPELSAGMFESLAKLGPKYAGE